MSKLLTKILKTPAKSLAGLAAKARIVVEDDTGDDDVCGYARSFARDLHGDERHGLINHCVELRGRFTAGPFIVKVAAARCRMGLGAGRRKHRQRAGNPQADRPHGAVL